MRWPQLPRARKGAGERGSKGAAALSQAALQRRVGERRHPASPRLIEGRARRRDRRRG